MWVRNMTISIFKKTAASAVCLTLMLGFNFAFAQSSAPILQSLIENSIDQLGEGATEREIRLAAIKILEEDQSQSSVQSSAIIAVVSDARDASEMLTVRALEDLIYENTDFDCQSVDSLVFKSWLGIERLPDDRTEFETQDDIELVLDQCGASDDVVAQALTSMIQTAQISGDETTVIALTNLVGNAGEEILEGSAELAQAINSAQFVSPVGAPPSGAATGGSDY